MSHRSENSARPTEIVLANEFAEIRLRVRETRNGRELEVFSARTQQTTFLDPFALDLLTSISATDLAPLVQRQYDVTHESPDEEGHLDATGLPR